MSVSIELRGSDSIQKKLDALSQAVRGRMLERALVAGALLVQNDAKQRITDYPLIDTGTLRRSIHIGGHADLATDFEGVDTLSQPEVNQNAVTVFVGTDLEYAHNHEYGTTVPARPYLRPALDENHAEIKREFGEAVQDLIRAAVR